MATPSSGPSAWRAPASAGLLPRGATLPEGVGGTITIADGAFEVGLPLGARAAGRTVQHPPSATL